MTTPQVALVVAEPPAGPAPATASRQPEALAARVRSGDRMALAELFRLHGTRIYNHCYRRTASWTQAEDLTSEVFLVALKVCAKAPDADEALLPWLYSIATNVVRNQARSARRGRDAIARMPVAESSDGFSGELVDSLDADARLRAALARLADFPQPFQDAFHLVVWEGLSYDDAAPALHCPVGTIRSRISRVRTALRLTDQSDEVAR